MISVVRCLHDPAYIIRLDGQFPVSPVDQDAQLHPPWPPVFQKGIQRRARRSARVKDVVHKDCGLGLHGKRRGGLRTTGF